MNLNLLRHREFDMCVINFTPSYDSHKNPTNSEALDIIVWYLHDGCAWVHR